MKINFHALGLSGMKFSQVQFTYEMLIGEKSGRTLIKKQAALLCAVLALVREAALQFQEKIDADAEYKGIYTKILQGVSKSYENLLKNDIYNSETG